MSAECFRLLKVGMRWQIASHFASSVLSRRMRWPERLQHSEKQLCGEWIIVMSKAPVIPMSVHQTALKGETKKIHFNLVSKQINPIAFS